MVGALVVAAGRPREQRIAERLGVPLEPDHAPGVGVRVAAVLWRREAALECVPDQEIDEAAAPAAGVRREHLGIVDLREDPILLRLREVYEDPAEHFHRDL